MVLVPIHVASLAPLWPEVLDVGEKLAAQVEQSSLIPLDFSMLHLSTHRVSSSKGLQQLPDT